MKTASFATLALLVAVAGVAWISLRTPIVPPAPPAPPAVRVPEPPGPPIPPHAEGPATPLAVPTGDGLFAVRGRLSVTPARAREDARKRLAQVVAERLAADGVSPTWRAPETLVETLVVKTENDAVKKDLGVPGIDDYQTLYTATLHADLSERRLAPLFNDYGRVVLRRRLGLLGGGLAFVLACLAGLAGYIRADEATKGYYTNRLRLLAAGGVGAAGAVLYRMLV